MQPCPETGESLLALLPELLPGGTSEYLGRNKHRADIVLEMEKRRQAGVPCARRFVGLLRLTAAPALSGVAGLVRGSSQHKIQISQVSGTRLAAGVIQPSL